MLCIVQTIDLSLASSVADAKLQEFRFFNIFKMSSQESKRGLLKPNPIRGFDRWMDIYATQPIGCSFFFSSRGHGDGHIDVFQPLHNVLLIVARLLVAENAVVVAILVFFILGAVRFTG
jgi:hypothetical protein